MLMLTKQKIDDCRLMIDDLWNRFALSFCYKIKLIEYLQSTIDNHQSSI